MAAVLELPVHSSDLTGVCLIKDAIEVSGHGILVLLLRKLLVEDSRVVVLCVAQSSAHYQHVLRKLGVGVGSLTESGDLVFINGLTASTAQQGGLWSLFQQVQDAAFHFATGSVSRGGAADCSGHVAVIIDDLSALAAVQLNVSEWTAFMHACCMLPAKCEAYGAANSCLLTLVHGDVAVDTQRWLPRLEHRANVVLAVEFLEQGMSAGSAGGALDASGLLMLTRRLLRPALPQSAADDEQPLPQQAGYYFKAGDAKYSFVAQHGRQNLYLHSA